MPRYIEKQNVREEELRYLYEECQYTLGFLEERGLQSEARGAGKYDRQLLK